jgi:hemolysin activation/secretion protein
MRKPFTRPLTKVVSPCSIALVGILASSYVQAQALPSAGGLLNQQQQLAQPPKPQSTTPAELGLPAQPEPGAPAQPTELSVQLHSITFNGDADVAAKEDLQALTQPMVGKTLGHAGMQQLVDTLTEYLRGRGYVLARAYLPPQDLTEGNLVITVVAGRLEPGDQRITVTGDTRSSHARLAAIAAAALPQGVPLKKEDLERALLLINDQPGVTAHASIAKGDEPGTSKLLVNATEGPLVSGQLSVDNYGNRSTGKERGNAIVSLNDPLHIGDQLTAGFSKTSGSEVANLGYSVPLTASGLRLLLGGSYLHYRVNQDTYSALDLSGHAVVGSVGLDYPLIRSRTQNLNASVLYEHKQLDDDALGTNLSSRKIDDATLALTGNRFDSFAGGGLVEARVALTLGHANLAGNPEDEAADALSARTAGNYAKLALNLSRLQTLDSNWSVYAGMSAQLANQNLDSSEKFLLGGPTGVRGYPVGEGAGDEGWLGTLELRRYVNVGLPSVKVQALGFFDAGQITLHHQPWAGSTPNAGNTNSYWLSSAGVGVNVWSGRWNLHGAVARTIGSNPGSSLSGADADGLATGWRAWIQLGMAF